MKYLGVLFLSLLISVCANEVKEEPESTSEEHLSEVAADNQSTVQEVPSSPALQTLQPKRRVYESSSPKCHDLLHHVYKSYLNLKNAPSSAIVKANPQKEQPSWRTLHLPETPSCEELIHKSLCSFAQRNNLSPWSYKQSYTYPGFWEIPQWDNNQQDGQPPWHQIQFEIHPSWSYNSRDEQPPWYPNQFDVPTWSHSQWKQKPSWSHKQWEQKPFWFHQHWEQKPSWFHQQWEQRTSWPQNTMEQKPSWSQNPWDFKPSWSNPWDDLPSWVTKPSEELPPWIKQSEQQRSGQEIVTWPPKPKDVLPQWCNIIQTLQRLCSNRQQAQNSYGIVLSKLLSSQEPPSTDAFNIPVDTSSLFQ